MMLETKLSADRVVAGRYALFDEIGVGGMAAVHIGQLRGAAGFMRTVAIKRLHASYVRDPDFVSMLIDEARLASRIRHPNVVQTLDVVVDRRELFVVMEYIHGESLSTLLRLTRERPIRIPCRIAVTIMADVLRGLHAAHETTDERGQSLDLVHRDISPQNLIVGTDGLTRVLDFGIAKSAGSLHVSQMGTLKGKFSYVAPEQIGDDSVSRQSDIYSASVVLWEMLTGERLFHGDNPESTLAKVLTLEISPPSRQASGLPTGLDAVVLRGLARNPSKRYATANAMAADLAKCCRLESHGVVAQWLENIAADRLRQRAECVARVERDVEAVPQSSDLRELLGQLVQPDSVRPERPTQVDLRATVPAEQNLTDSRLSGTVSVASTRHLLKRRRQLLASAAACLLAGVVVTWLVTSVRHRSRAQAHDAYGPVQTSSAAASERAIAQPKPIMESHIDRNPSNPPASASPAAEPARSAQAPVQASKRTKEASAKRGGKSANGSVAAKPSKSASPFSNLGGRL